MEACTSIATLPCNDVRTCLTHRGHRRLPRFLACGRIPRLHLHGTGSPLLSASGHRRLSQCGLTRRPHVVVAAVENGEGPRSGKGQQLWRKELESSDALSDFDAFDDEIRQSAAIEKDIERLARKEEVEKLLAQPRASKAATEDDGGGVIRDVADKILVADFFFIIFILAWLLAGLAEQAALQSSTLIDAWLPLWPSLFQPALGVFMAGAIVSALTKKK